MKDFKHFTQQSTNELHRNTWSMQISPDSFKSKKIHDFINNVSDIGLTNLQPFIDKKYNLVAFLVKIQKTIYIWTYEEWIFYNN